LWLEDRERNDDEGERKERKREKRMEWLFVVTDRRTLTLAAFSRGHE